MTVQLRVHPTSSLSIIPSLFKLTSTLFYPHLTSLGALQLQLWLSLFQYHILSFHRAEVIVPHTQRPFLYPQRQTMSFTWDDPHADLPSDSEATEEDLLDNPVLKVSRPVTACTRCEPARLSTRIAPILTVEICRPKCQDQVRRKTSGLYLMRQVRPRI